MEPAISTLLPVILTLTTVAFTSFINHSFYKNRSKMDKQESFEWKILEKRITVGQNTYKYYSFTWG